MMVRALADGLCALAVIGCAAATPLAPSAVTAITPVVTNTVHPTITLPSLPTAAPTLTPTAAPLPLEVQIAVSATSIVQGQTAQLEVTCNQPCRASVYWGGQALHVLSSSPERAWALMAAHALSEPMAVQLRVDAATASGQSVSLISSLPVMAGEFDTEDLTFSAETQALLAPEISDAENARMNEVFAVYSPQQLWSGPFAMPWGGPITSEFGTRRNYQGTVQSFHTGLDIDGEAGDVIAACADGVVILAEKLQVRGNAVIINHGAGVMSGYYHLDSIDVKEGQIVHQGDQIGTMGTTGLSTGSHLHWEVRVGGVAVSPHQWADQSFGEVREKTP